MSNFRRRTWKEKGVTCTQEKRQTTEHGKYLKGDPDVGFGRKMLESSYYKHDHRSKGNHVSKN